MKPAGQELRFVLGTCFRKIRESRGLLQEDLAVAGRQLGLDWTRSTIAAIELGRRKLDLEEFILLPLLFLDETSVALADFVPRQGYVSIGTDPFTGQSRVISCRAVRSALSGEGADQVHKKMSLTKNAGAVVGSFDAIRRLAHQPRDFERLCARIAPDWHPSNDVEGEIRKKAKGDAELKAAGSLGVPALAVSIAALRTWGRSLSEEREIRLGKPVRGESARSRQARRGNVTRELLAEIAEALRAVRETALHREPSPAPESPASPSLPARETP